MRSRTLAQPASRAATRDCRRRHARCGPNGSARIVAAAARRRHVEYVGYVADERREALFAGARALVLPSLDEGFGLTALEAMSAGVPVLASNRGSLPEVVGTGGVAAGADRRGRLGIGDRSRDQRRGMGTRPGVRGPRPREGVHLGRPRPTAGTGVSRCRRSTSRPQPDMRIAIDAREIVGKPTGVGRYLSQILSAWAKLPGAAAHEFILCTPEALLPARWAPLKDFECVGRGIGHGVGTARAPTPDQDGRRRCPVRSGIHRAALMSGPDRVDRPRRVVRRPPGVVLVARRTPPPPDHAGERTAGRPRADAVRIHEAGSRATSRPRSVARGCDLSRARRRFAPRTLARSTRIDEPLVLYVGSLFNRRHVPELIEGFARLARAASDRPARDRRRQPHDAGHRRRRPHRAIGRGRSDPRAAVRVRCRAVGRCTRGPRRSRSCPNTKASG